MNKTADILVLGAGAAGFFAACSAAEAAPGAKIVLLEKGRSVLAKVKVSGGGRCNVTCGEDDPKRLAAFYPRGARMLSRLYFSFGPKEVKEWFESRGVKLKTEPDGRVFPVSNSSQTIIDCLLREAEKHNFEIEMGVDAQAINQENGEFRLTTRTGEAYLAKAIVVATGGSPKAEGLDWLKQLGHEVQNPVPSLFTFNSPGNPICKLMGVSVPLARVRIAGTKFEYSGPTLITHWGLSGPAVLKLSAFAATELAAINYMFNALINWTGLSQPEFEIALKARMEASPKRFIEKLASDGISASLWQFLLQEADIDAQVPAEQLGKKKTARLIEVCCNYNLPVKGKTTFKDEFVTAGGVSLNSIHPSSMESKALPGLFFAGEVLDMDGITGGYNFQAAWTTGYVAGKAAAQKI